MKGSLSLMSIHEQKIKSRIVLFSLLLMMIFLVHGCRNNDEEKTLFFSGRTLVTEGRYNDAIPLLNQYMAEHPNGNYASRAGLFLGKSHLALESFGEARNAWQMVIDNYPKSLEAHKSAYKLAILDFLQGDTEEALAQFKKLSGNVEINRFISVATILF